MGPAERLRLCSRRGRCGAMRRHAHIRSPLYRAGSGQPGTNARALRGNHSVPATSANAGNGYRSGLSVEPARTKFPAGASIPVGDLYGIGRMQCRGRRSCHRVSRGEGQTRATAPARSRSSAALAGRRRRRGLGKPIRLADLGAHVERTTTPSRASTLGRRLFYCSPVLPGCGHQ